MDFTMKDTREAELKKLYSARLRESGYKTVKDLVNVLPPIIKNLTGASVSTSEKIFLAALKSQMKNIQENYNGDHPEGITKALTDLGYMTVHEIAEANPSIIAKTLEISLKNAGDIVLYAMELTLKTTDTKVVVGDEMLSALDQEVSHYFAKMDRERTEDTSKVDEAVSKIHETIKLPDIEHQIQVNQKQAIERLIDEFMTVFPSCTGFIIYNRRSKGVFHQAKDLDAKNTIFRINNTISNIFWKISLVLEEKNEYGWIESQSHLVWIEAIRDKNQKRQIAYIGLFIFESESESVGTATPTIKGIIKEIERIIYEQ